MKGVSLVLCAAVFHAVVTASYAELEAKENETPNMPQFLRGDGKQTQKLTATQPQCLDDNGQPIDWYSAFKFSNGYEYAIFEESQGMHMSQNDLNSSSKGAISATTAQLFGADPNQISYVAYNDEPGNSGSSAYGHTKGFLAFNSNGGFWMIHSVPNWPVPDSWGQYKGFPEDETIYSQSFLCMTLDFEDFDNVGELLQYNRPNIYHSHLTDEATQQLQKMADAVKGDHISDAGSTNIKFKSGNMEFDVFAKNGNWGKDLYGDLVAPTLKQNLYVETWIRGYEIGPYCKPKHQYEVLDVEHLDWMGHSYKETQDHSKWAISMDSSYVCIGDINRMTSQFKRGGGTACFQSSQLHQKMEAAITQHDSCSSA